MFKRIGLSAAALLAAITLMQAPASAENRNYGGASGHYTSTQYTRPAQKARNDQRPDDRRQTERNFQTHRDHDDWNARNSSRW